MIYGEILCKWNNDEGPVIIWIATADIVVWAGCQAGQNWVKSGKDQVTRRREDLEVVRPENLLKVEDQTRLEGLGLMVWEDSYRIPTYYCTFRGFCVGKVGSRVGSWLI